MRTLRVCFETPARSSKPKGKTGDPMRSDNAIPFDRKSFQLCDMRDSKTPRIHLAFGFQTALQIFRSLDREAADKRRYSRIVSHDADAAVVRGTSPTLPCGVPSKPDLSRAFDRLRLEHPGLEFDMPAHLLIGSGSRCRSNHRAIVHLCQAEIPRRALCRLNASTVLASPNLALCQMRRALGIPSRFCSCSGRRAGRTERRSPAPHRLPRPRSTCCRSLRFVRFGRSARATRI